MLWVKAFHIVFVVAWYAGLLYLPRLFVYHAGIDDEAGQARFEVMEHKLFRIMTVGAVGSVGLGLWLLLTWWNAMGSAMWLHAKLILVIALIVYHVLCGRIVHQFRTRANKRSHVFYRYFNEVPALILIAITVLVVVKPF